MKCGQAIGTGWVMILLAVILLLPAPLAAQGPAEGPMGKAKVDVNYIPETAIAGGMINLKQILSHLSAEERATFERFCRRAAAETGIDPRDLVSITFSMGLPPMPGEIVDPAFFEEYEDPSIYTMRFSRPIEREKLKGQLLRDTSVVEYNGKEIHQPEHGWQPSVYFPDERTVVVGGKKGLRRVIDSPQSMSQLVSNLRSGDGEADFLLAVQIEPLRETYRTMRTFMEESGDVPLPFREFLTVPDHLASALLEVRLDRDTPAVLYLEAENEESAAKIHKLSEELLVYAKGMWTLQRGALLADAPDRELGEHLGKMVDRLLAGVSMKRDREQVEVVVKVEGGLRDTVDLGVQLAELQQRQMDRIMRMNNLRMIGLAMHNYHSTHEEWPTGVRDKDGKLLLSWRVQILPYLEGEGLYEEFKLDEPWDSEHNLKLLERMPAAFQSRGADEFDLEPAVEEEPVPLVTTRYLGIFGEGMTFGSGKRTIADMRDGTSNTAIVVEVHPEKGVPWTKPDDAAIDLERPAAAFGAAPAGGFSVLFADGSCHTVPADTPADVWKAIFTIAGGEAVARPGAPDEFFGDPGVDAEFGFEGAAPIEVERLLPEGEAPDKSASDPPSLFERP